MKCIFHLIAVSVFLVSEFHCLYSLCTDETVSDIVPYLYLYKMTLDLSHLTSEGQGRKHYICAATLCSVSQLTQTHEVLSLNPRCGLAFLISFLHGFAQSLQMNAGLLS